MNACTDMTLLGFSGQSDGKNPEYNIKSMLLCQIVASHEYFKPILPKHN